MKICLNRDVRTAVKLNKANPSFPLFNPLQTLVFNFILSSYMNSLFQVKHKEFDINELL